MVKAIHITQDQLIQYLIDKGYTDLKGSEVRFSASAEGPKKQKQIVVTCYHWKEEKIIPDNEF